MKVFVKTLKGSHFEIDVEPSDTIAAVKKHIETIHGPDVYPFAQQLLIHQGKVLKDETTLVDNKVAENNFIVIMLTKPKGGSSSGASTTPATPNPVASNPTISPPLVPQAAATTAPAPQESVPTPTPTAAAEPTVTVPAAPQESLPTPTPTAAAEPTVTVPALSVDAYGEAASNLVAGSNLEQAIQQIVDMGGGSWDRETVVRAMRAAYNNPERAVDYLYSGIPEQAEPAPPPSVARSPAIGQATNPSIPVPPQSAQQTVPSSGPNANPLDLFPQGLPNMGSNVGGGGLDFLRNSQQFRALRTMVQANPQILQPMLQELGRQNPHLMRLIQEHQADFVRIMNEPVDGAEGDVLSQLAAGISQDVQLQVTPEEREAIERLEAMGFDRAIVLEVFFACNKNEQLAANYLLDHYNEFEE